MTENYGDSVTLTLYSLLIDFIMSYFNLWAGLALTVLGTLCNEAKRSLLYENEVYTERVILVTGIVLVAVAFCWSFHVILTFFGMYFVEAEILRQGNDQILDDLEEGVIIKEEHND